jgi:hypothetical protein
MSTEATVTAGRKRHKTPAPPRSKAGAKAGAVSTRRPSTRRAEANQEVITELRALRGVMDEMLDRYRLRVGGRISELALLLEGDPSIGAAAMPVTTRVAHAMIGELKDTRLRPRKGRAKDIRRLESLVEALATLAGEH